MALDLTKPVQTEQGDPARFLGELVNREDCMAFAVMTGGRKEGPRHEYLILTNRNGYGDCGFHLINVPGPMPTRS